MNIHRSLVWGHTDFDLIDRNDACVPLNLSGEDRAEIECEKNMINHCVRQIRLG